MNILLIEPSFPKPSKSKNHNDFLPIGLLKIAAYHRKKNDGICIIRGEIPKREIFFESPRGGRLKNSNPDHILITSYFTYWAKYVKKCVSFYKKLYPNTKITVGGVYASLMPEHCKKYTKCDDVYVGIHPEAEKCQPAYRYLEKYYGPVDFQIIHTSRGCIRKCDFCGVFQIEPKFTYKESIKDEIIKKKIIFYDNNLLANPSIENILVELAYMKEKGKIKECEAQSGLDGRLIEKIPDLAFLLKKAGFKKIRIGWDGPYKDLPHIKRQLELLEKVGFNIQEEVFLFMIYNWDIPYEEMEKKRIKCWEWKVQISDCRYRPLDQTFDKYSGQKFEKGQTSADYYIHKRAGWTDRNIRTFRKRIRQQNMCIRFKFPFYTNVIERNHLSKSITKKLIFMARNLNNEKLEQVLDLLKIPYWFPENLIEGRLQVSKKDIYEEFENQTNKPATYNRKESSYFKRWRNNCLRKTLDQLSYQQF